MEVTLRSRSPGQRPFQNPIHTSSHLSSSGILWPYFFCFGLQVALAKCISLGSAGDATLGAMLSQKARSLRSGPCYLDVRVTYLKKVFTETSKKYVVCVEKNMAF